jgi:SPP1 family predicted phage head-tail adaptor
MIARQYTRKIQLFKTSSVSDGFGGNTVNDVLIGSYWAEVKQNSAFKDNAIGNSQIKNNYTFKIRASINFDMDISNLSIVYRDAKYVVNDIRYDDELFRFIAISANGIS